MLDLIRANALSSHQMMSASKGALRLPAAEMVEILVYMAEHNKIFGANARFTLAAWDEVSARAIVADSSTPREVLDYWLDPRNLRSALFPLLLENESVPLTKTAELATTLKSEWIEAMIVSPRVRTAIATPRTVRATNFPTSSGAATNTIWRSPMACTAARGTIIAGSPRGVVNAIVANMPRRRRPAGFGTSTLTLAVRVCESTRGSM